MSFLLVIATLTCMGAAAFFNASETALLSCDQLNLKKLKRQGNRRATLALHHLEDLDYLLSTTQFGVNLFISLAATLGTLFLHRISHNHNLLIFVLFAPCTLVFTDSLPKVLGRHLSESFALSAALPLTIFAKMFTPVLRLISLYTQQLGSVVGLEKQDTLSRRKKTREELQSLLLDSDRGSDIRQRHKRIIRKVLEFSQQNVKKVMVPLVSVDAIEHESTVQEAIDLFETLRHSRLPVYQERIDNIIGMLYFPDVFHCKKPEDEKVSEYMQPAVFVPEMQQLATLTKEMQETEIAVVVDEYGGAVGIVTKEDVLEEIVGDISDEWDEHNLGAMEISPDTYLVHCSTSITDLNERLQIQVPKGEYETLSGFLLLQFNRIPSIGDELFFGNFKVRVHRASKKAIETAIIHVNRSETEKRD